MIINKITRSLNICILFFDSLMMVSNGQLLANVSNTETDRDTCANLAYFCSYLKYLKYRLPERIIKIQPCL